MEALIELSQSWAICNGLILKSHTGTSYQCDPIPFTLSPTAITRKGFEKVVSIAPLLNTLVDRMSRDSKFINDSLLNVAQYDRFVKRLLELYNETYSKACTNYQMAIHRSDYMMHVDEKTGEETPQQVEINTISSASGALGSVVHHLHAYLQQYRSWLVPEYCGYELHPNESMEKIAHLMQTAHITFLNRKKPSTKQHYVLFVVQDGERNVGDQKAYEFLLLKKYGVFVLRRSLSELIGNIVTGEADELVLDGKYPISVVYFRSAYTPNDYPSDKEWDVRRILETSSAIKCPSIGVQLVGTKKVQQIMFKKEVLEKYLTKEEAKSVKEAFTGIYSLDETEHVQDAFENPDDYVMKPQREGGGHLVFGERMQSFLNILLSQPEHEEYATIKNTYILMKKIKPKRRYNEILRLGKVETGECVSELGIFGIYLGDGKEEVVNDDAGYLLRTKLAKFQDGGIANGIGSLDSVYLC